MTQEPAITAAYRDIDPAEAQRLVESGDVRVLDVRTSEEFTSLGHIPGATLLPVNELPARLTTIESEGKPLLICCEHGVRSEAAAGFLAAHGFRGLLNLQGGMASWTGPREF